MWYLVYVNDSYQMMSEETLTASFVNMGEYWQHIEYENVTLQILGEHENPAVIARELFNIKRN